MQKILSNKYLTTAPFLALGVGVFLFLYHLSGASFFTIKYDPAAAVLAVGATTTAYTATPLVPVLDVADYNERMWALANNGTSSQAMRAKEVWMGVVSSTSQLEATTTATSTTPIKKFAWPVKTPYPLPGAILPFHRIIAYYGNFYSRGMGVLGQYPKDVMLSKLADEVAKWNAADPTTPVMPAIDYIAVTAQASAGADGKYRLRMPDSQIDIALKLAEEVHGIVILEVQVGLSTLEAELPPLKKYLSMPNVHLAIDPEFSIKGKSKPGDIIGTMSAQDVNFAANYLAKLVRENNLPPKVLVVHRFTGGMVTGYKQITPLPEVQIVMDMDGWGGPAKKIGTYRNFIAAQPVQFTGFKLFYKNDLFKPSTRILTPEELLKLSPKPSFIQFQ